MGPNPPLGSGPLSFTSRAPSSFIFMGFNIVEGEPAPPGQFTLSSYTPNIRPQVDLNQFMSISNT